jgi:hypothetical protein
MKIECRHHNRTERVLQRVRTLVLPGNCWVVGVIKQFVKGRVVHANKVGIEEVRGDAYDGLRLECAVVGGCVRVVVSDDGPEVPAVARAWACRSSHRSSRPTTAPSVLTILQWGSVFRRRATASRRRIGSDTTNGLDVVDG